MIVEELKKHKGLVFRPKTYITMSYNSVFISCYPQQHWELLAVDEVSWTVEIRYKIVSMRIEIDDFLDNWRLV